jgi:hypothetical protein
MWKDKLLYIIILSVLVHGSFFFLLAPQFNYNKENNLLVNWRGDIPYLGLRAEKPGPPYRYDDFFLEYQKREQVSLGKIRYEGIRDIKAGNIDASLFYQEYQPDKEVYNFIVSKENILFNPYFFVNEDVPLWDQVYPAEDIFMDLLVSPTGRVIAVKKVELRGYLFLRESLEKQARRLTFPSKDSYYWRHVEIKVQ